MCKELDELLLLNSIIPVDSGPNGNSDKQRDKNNQLDSM